MMDTMDNKPQTTNLTNLSVNRAIVHMAMPAMGSMLVESLYHLVDTFWVGKLGAAPMAAASAAAFLLWTIFSLSDLAGVAANTLSSQAVGADRSDKVAGILRQCLLAALFLSVILMLLALPFRRYLFMVLGLEAEVVVHAEAYLLPWLLGMPLFFLLWPVYQTFRGTGDARTPMLLTGLMVVLNAFLDPIFIFGFGPIPEFGLAGAAWVSVILHAVSFAVGIRILRRRGLWPEFTGRSFFKPDPAMFRKIVRIGLPIALNGAVFSLTYIGLTGVIALFGTPAVAAIGMGHRVESLPWFVSYGFSVAAASLVGQYIGAGRPDAAAQAAWRTCFLAGVLISFLIGIVWLFAEPIVQFFIADPVVVAESSLYLRIAMTCWLAGIFEVVLEGAFSGSGHTLPPLVIGMPLTILRIPAAYFLSVTLGWGSVGVWWAIGGSMILKGGAMAFWFSRNRWKPHPALGNET